MRILVLGGIRSGKSEWAESVIAQSVGAEDPVRYLATGPVADDDAWAQRVPPTARAGRITGRPSKPLMWQSNCAPTIRCPRWSTTSAAGSPRRWTARTHGPAAPVRADVDDLLDAVAGYQAELVLVSPEVGLTVVPETVAGRRFADELGALNQRLAAAVRPRGAGGRRASPSR